jgi:hypothetical protein
VEATAAEVTRYVAHFQPRGVVDGLEVQVDLQGPQEWDCTGFAASWQSYLMGLRTDLDGWRFDWRKALKSDPAAPAWVRDWCGPCYLWVCAL